MKQANRSGFTIVELLVVIVVIAILAAVTIVAFNGIQTRAKNTAQKDAVAKFVKLFMIYKETSGAYPADAGCLGENNVDTTSDGTPDCNDDGNLTYNSALNTKLKTIGTIPKIIPDQIMGSDGVKRAGVRYDGSGGIYYFLKGSTADCTRQNGGNGSAGQAVWCWEPLPS